MRKHSFSITEDDIILLNGIELPQRNIFEFLESQRIQLANQEKESAALKEQLSDYQQDMAVLAGENEALVKRWEELERWLLKDSWAEAVSPAVWAKMKELAAQGEG